MHYLKPNFVALTLALSIPSIVVSSPQSEYGYTCDDTFFRETEVEKVREKIAELRTQPKPFEAHRVLPQYPLRIRGIPKPHSQPKYGFPILQSGEIYSGGETGPYFVFVNRDNSLFHALIKEGDTWRQCIWGQKSSVKDRPKARPIDSSQSSSQSSGFSRSSSDSKPDELLEDDADSEHAKIYGWVARSAHKNTIA